MKNSHVECRDIVEQISFPDYDVLYCDPPWEDRMVKWFQTQYRKDTGLMKSHTIIDVISTLAGLANTSKPAFVEYSIKGSELVIDIFKNHGHTYCGQVRSLYANDMPYVTMMFNTDVRLPEGTYDDEVLSAISRQLSPRTIFDPFAGIGHTASIVMGLGIDYIGYELNPARAKKCSEVIRKMKQK